MFKDGVRQREYDTVKDVPPLSGKLLAEFTKRRSIRDMFSKKPALPKSAPTPTSKVIEKETTTKADISSTPSKIINDSDKDLELAIAASLADMPSAVDDNPTSSQSPLKSAGKRRASASASPNKPVKRGKTNALTTASKASKGQQSLKGFFQTQTKPADADPLKGSAPPASPSAINYTPSQSTTDMSAPQSPITSDSFDADPRATQEASKEGWTKLFSKKPIPRCEHGEPCMSMTTKKPGMNCGRQFWMCPRPIGPTGHREVGTQWRCGTFIWCSDWKGS
jgi:AP endonuclease-2